MSASEQQDVGAPKGIESQPLATDTVNESRRRWLIGALAGPAAVSLPVTASAAAFGSITTCVENLPRYPGAPLHVAWENADKYARKRVRGVVVEYGKRRSYRTETLVEYSHGKMYDQNYNQWIRKSYDKYVCPTGETYRDEGTRVWRYTLVFADVDDYGDFLATDPESQKWGAAPVTTSCYVSIAPLKL